jgi:hypothetical protein
MKMRRYKFVSIDLDDPGADWQVVVPERQNKLTDGASIVGDKLLTYLKGCHHLVANLAMDGTPHRISSWRAWLWLAASAANIVIRDVLYLHEQPAWRDLPAKHRNGAKLVPSGSRN